MEDNMIGQNAPEEKGSIGKRRKDALAREKKAGIQVGTPANIRYSGIKLDSEMEKQAKDIVSKLSDEAGEKVKRVFLAKNTVQPGVPDSAGKSIVFKVELANQETFIGAVLRNPADMPKAGGTGFNVYEAMRELPSIKTVFVNKGGSIKQLSDADWVSSETKDAIRKFLRGLVQFMDAGTPAKMDRPVGYSQDNVGRKQEDFKSRIAEIAAKIAGNINEYEAEKVDLPSSILVKYNSNIVTATDLAQAILDFMREILAKEPSLKGVEDKSGWNSVVSNLERLSGSKKQDAEKTLDAPEAPSTDSLEELFNRINRK